MNLDFSFNVGRIKKALNMRTLLIILLITAFLTTIFYITLENREKKEILIWHITENDESLFSKDQLELASSYARDRGFDRLIFTRRNPSDQYFDAAMSTTAYYNCDIFIMTEEMAINYAESDMLLAISQSGYPKESLLYIGDTAVGLSIDNNYYLLINAKSAVDMQTVYHIYDILAGENK